MSEPRHSPFRTTQKERGVSLTAAQFARKTAIDIKSNLRRSVTNIVNNLIPHRQTHLFDGNDQIIYISTTEPENSVPAVLWVVPQQGGDGSRVFIATNVGIAYTYNMIDETISWGADNAGLSGDALDVYQFAFDPFSVEGDFLAAAYISTKDGIYKSTSVPGGTWTQVLSPSALATLIGANQGASITQFTRELVVSSLREGYIGFVAQRTVTSPGASVRFYWVYSYDGGTTWATSGESYFFESASANADSNGFTIAAHAYASEKEADTLYLSVYTDRWWAQTTAVTKQAHLFVSTNNGGTWSDAGQWVGGTRAPQLVFPYAGAEGATYSDDDRAWRFDQDRTGTISGSHYREIQHSDEFAGPFTPTEWDDSGFDSTSLSSAALGICKWNENYVYVIPDGSTSLYYSTDGGYTFSSTVLAAQGQILATLPSLPQYCVVMRADSGSPGNAAVYRSLDGGETFLTPDSDLNTNLANIAYIRAVAPDWVYVMLPLI